MRWIDPDNVDAALANATDHFNAKYTVSRMIEDHIGLLTSANGYTIRRYKGNLKCHVEKTLGQLDATEVEYRDIVAWIKSRPRDWHRRQSRTYTVSFPTKTRQSKRSIGLTASGFAQVRPLLAAAAKAGGPVFANASWLLHAGPDVYKLQKHLGHRSITTTLDRYSHLLPEGLRDTTAALDRAFGTHR